MLVIIEVVWELVFSLGETILVVKIRWRVLAFVALKGINEVSIGNFHALDSKDLEIGILDSFSSALQRGDKVFFLEDKSWLHMVAQKYPLLASRRKLPRTRSILLRIIPVDHLGTERNN